MSLTVAAFATRRRPGGRSHPAVHRRPAANSVPASASAPPAWMPAAPSSSTSRPTRTTWNRKSPSPTRAAPGAGAAGGGRGPAAGTRRRTDARRQRHRGAPSQHGQAARKADDAPPFRRARRLLHHLHHGLQPDEYKAERVRYIARWRLEKKDPNAAVSEPDQADRLLHRFGHSAEMGALAQERHGGLERGFRGRGLQERHPRKTGAHAASRTPPGARKTCAIR